MTLADWRGQPLLINFWASWCVPCRQEMPALVRLAAEHQAQGLAILAVNLTAQDTLPEINAFVKEMGLTFPVVLDTTGDVTTTLYRMPGLPSSVFIDRGGRITRIQLGAMTQQQMEEFVATILPRVPASKAPERGVYHGVLPWIEIVADFIETAAVLVTSNILQSCSML